MTTYALAFVLFAAGFGGVTGVAEAHKCDNYDRESCDPTACEEGENHKHTLRKKWYDPSKDESCESKADPQSDDCEYNDIEFPSLVCRLLEDTKTPE